MSMPEVAEKTASLEDVMAQIGQDARAAAKVLAQAPTAQKNDALKAMAADIRAHVPEIMAANASDLTRARASGVAAAFIDRLTLTPERIEATAKGLDDIAALPDPVGEAMANWQ